MPAKATPETCWLCARPLGHKIEWHHPVPKSRGGRVTEAVHPICHRTLHAAFTNVEMAKLPPLASAYAERSEVAKFLGWIADKPADFHAPTRLKR